MKKDLGITLSDLGTYIYDLLADTYGLTTDESITLTESVHKTFCIQKGIEFMSDELEKSYDDNKVYFKADKVEVNHA